MSVTTLLEIEACPRKWALSAAEYASLWSGRGYPVRVHLGAVAGSVVHLVLQRLTKQLALAGCASVEDPRAATVLKALGGYTKVVHECIDSLLGQLSTNPRAVGLLEHLGRSLRTRVAELRTRVQTIIARVKVQHRAHHAPTRDATSTTGRVPLTLGAFSEIELRAPAIRWKGKADLLAVSEDTCEITDFKIGEPDEVHKFHVKIYALLWRLDRELNPKSRLANRLVLAYSVGNVDVTAPTEAQLADLEREAVERRDAAHYALVQRPPEARPSAEACHYCGVRQLCDRYWTPETFSAMSSGLGDERRVSDVELRIVGPRDPSSWETVVVRSRSLAAGQIAVLRTATPAASFKIGDRVRVLDSMMAVDPEDNRQPATISTGMFSEIYIVTDHQR